MTGDLTTLFEGKEIRGIEKNGEPWFPVVDLASAWGVDPNTLYQILVRKKKKFINRVSEVHVTCTPSDDDPTYRSVNEPGLYVLLGAVNTDRLKNPEAAQAIDRFQYWVPELIQKYRKKEIVQVPAQEPTDQLKAELTKAKMIARETGGNLAAFQRIALEKCGLGDYAPALDQAPVIQHGEPGQWLNPTDIGGDCGLSAREVNAWLYNHDFQYPEGGLWRLTAKGEAYGQEYVFETTSAHREIRIRWHRSVLIASGLQKPLAENQLALPARA